MKFESLAIPDVLLCKLDVHGDHRGYFMETWRKEWFDEIDGDFDFVQDNQSRSKKGTLRGLHYQVLNPQGKLVRVLEGRIFDVAVDLRKSSAYFGNWVGIELDSQNKEALWLPPGFAHGFCVLSESAEMAYKCTDYYDAESERSLLWNDPEVGIDWPLATNEIVISDKDATGKRLRECEVYS